MSFLYKRLIKIGLISLLVYFCFIIKDQKYWKTKQKLSKNKLHWRNLSLPKIVKLYSEEYRFTGQPYRIFPSKLVRFSSTAIKCRLNTAADFERSKKPFCKKWGVALTAINKPTEGIRRMLYRKDWCIIVVASNKVQANVSPPGPDHVTDIVIQSF